MSRGSLNSLMTRSLESRLAVSWLATLMLIWFYFVMPIQDIWQNQALTGLVSLLMAFGVGLICGPASKTDSELEKAPATFWVPLIVLAGGIFRFYGISFGLPLFYHPDEFSKALAIERMATNGDLDPHYFLHPSLLLYLGYFVKTIIGVFGVDLGFKETAVFAGRLVSASAGTFTIYLTYVAGRQLINRYVGVLGAALLAFSPLHVTCSRYMKEDALLACMTMLCLVTLMKGVLERKRSLVILGGFLAGVAAASKYSGVLCLAFVVAVPWLQSRSFMPDLSMFPITGLAALMMPLGFLVCVPYSILNNEKFVADFLMEKGHMERGHSSAVSAWSQYWMFHYVRSIQPGVTKLVAVVGMIGFGQLVRAGKIFGLFLLAAFLLFYLPGEWVKAKPAPQPERYIYPCLPFICLAAAFAAQSIRQISARWFSTGFVVVLILVPALRTFELARDLIPDTRREMGKWIEENLPLSSKLYFDWRPYSPDLGREPFFKVTYINRPDYFTRLKIGDLKRSGQDYLVVSSMSYGRFFTEPNSSPAVRVIYRTLVEHYPIIHEVSAPSGTYGFANPILTLFSLRKEDQREDVVTYNLSKTEVPWFQTHLKHVLAGEAD